MNLRTLFNLYICVAIYYLLCGCTSERKGLGFTLIDVNASYWEKEIKLEDIVNIEYLQIGVYEDFLFSESPSIITSDKIIFGTLDGGFLVFSRDGKPLSKFNHRGGGPGEYPVTTGGPIYDAAADELYVKTHGKIMVYSSSGEFRRVLSLPKEASMQRIVNYDSATLLLYDEQELFSAPFSFISKEDGNVVETVNIPIGEKLNLKVPVMMGDSFTVFFQPSIGNIVKYKDGYLLADSSNDTIYYFSPYKKLLPTIVRKPKIHLMNPIITLSCIIEAGNYEFMYTEKVVQVKFEDRRLPRIYLMRDKQTGSVYKQKIVLNDYKGKEVNLSHETIMRTQDSKLGLVVLGLTELQEANRDNKLSGRLKELVDNSDEDGNDIFMLLHFK